MGRTVATIVYAVGILGLFILDRDRKSRTCSIALWVPILWVGIASSRMVSQWLQPGSLNGTPDVYLDGSPLDRLILSVLMALGFVVLVVRGRQVLSLLRANRAILVFFLYCAVSSLWSDYPEVAFKRSIKASGDLVMVLIILTESDRLTALKRSLARLSFVLVPVSVLFIKYYPELGRAYGRWEGVQYFIGVAADKNMLGKICLIFGLASAWRFLHEIMAEKETRKTGPLIAHGTTAFTALWLTWEAHSLTSLSCLLLAVGLMTALKLPIVARKPALIHLLVAFMLAASSCVLFSDAGSGLVQTLGRDPTLTGRTEVWNRVLGMSPNGLLGTGFESFWLGQRLQQLWSIFWWHPNEAHNGYIEIFLNLGWVGIALLTLMLVTGYRNAVKAFQQNENAGNLLLAYFVTVVAYSLTEAGFRMMNPVWITCLLSITAIPEARVVENRLTLEADEVHHIAVLEPHASQFVTTRAGRANESF